jgi:catechol 2,3-dioxygenase-like lactoylglutathione lyase family enzyme
MKRFHVHVSVADLAQSVRFYSTLFGAQPTVQQSDYAKWMLDDPRVNFAISQRGGPVGVDHLGVQTDSDDELAGLRAQLEQADLATREEANASCCYALSNKVWVTDPAGIAWETFHTLGSVPTFNGQPAGSEAAACCAPAAPVKVAVTIPVAPARACCG